MDTQQKKSDAKNRRRKKKRDIWPVKVFFITLADSACVKLFV